MDNVLFLNLLIGGLIFIIIPKKVEFCVEYLWSKLVHSTPIEHEQKKFGFDPFKIRIIGFFSLIIAILYWFDLIG